MDGDLLARASWIWGLSLIALTIAIQATGVVMMALYWRGSGPGWSTGALAHGVWSPS